MDRTANLGIGGSLRLDVLEPETSRGQNGQLVHWWLLVHSGRQMSLTRKMSWTNTSGLTLGLSPAEGLVGCEPIECTEQPTGALVAAGSLWPPERL